MLFVHGIGEQQQGSTLLQFGEPIIETLRRWYMGQMKQGVDCVRVTESVLLPAKNFDTTPAHSVVEFDLGPCHPKKKWLLAEDWWGDQVVIPDSTEFITWLMTRGAWVMLLHLIDRFTRRLGVPPIRVLLLVLTAVPWTIFALTLQIPLLLAFVITWLPIPTISAWVTGLVRRVVSVLGDSFILVKLESQRGAILSHFAESLKYVQSQCRHVAVVAHSQGTAVVCEVLRTDKSLIPRLLVTFGAGLAKLDQLYLAEANRRLSLTIAGFVPTVFVAAVIAYFAAPLWASVSLAALWAGLAWFVIKNMMDSGEDLKSYYHGPGRSERLAAAWEDYFASYDPVPSAPLNELFPKRIVEPKEIQNRNSYLSDHTTYFSNFAQFVFPLCRLLASHGETPDADVDIRVDAGFLVDHHRRMVRLYQLTFILTLVFVIAEAGWFQDRFIEVGRSTWTSMPWNILPGWILSLKPALALLQPAFDELHASEGQQMWAFATLLLMLVMLLYRVIFGNVWEWWNLQAMESSLQHKETMVPLRSIGHLAWLTFVAFAPLIAIAGWLLR